MKNTIITLLLLISILQTKAQEPQWSINLYFEDATGATDMLTFGYDSSAGQFIEDIDPQFDEGWIQIDTTQFNVYIQKNTNSGHPIQPPINTNIVRKKSIGSWLNPSIEFGWVHGQLPVTMTWDEPKLNSPDLPNHFIDETPCTRARIDMWYEGGGLNEPYCIHTVVDPYQPPTSTLINTLNESPCYVQHTCTFQNSITWTGWQDNQEIGELMWDIPVVMIVPFNDYYWDPTIIIGVEDLEFTTKVFPNPVTNYLYIESQVETFFNITIYNMLGKMILQNTFQGNKKRINVNHLKAGIYYLKTNNQTIKFIKQ